MSRKANDRLQFDLFAPSVSDLPVKDQRDIMERPVFSLSKRKRLKSIDYRSPDGTVFVKVEPHQNFGMATIWDADILIWAASIIRSEIERGRNDVPGPTIHFQPYNLLKSIHRPCGGEHYQRLRAALDRLRTTSIKTNIRSSDKSKKEASFSWLDEWTDDIDPKTGLSRGMSMTINRWLYEGILDERLVLSIDPAYFDLTGGLERWLYRIARKHAGMQRHGWSCSLSTLYDKSGCEDTARKFRAALKRITEADNLPEYHLEWLEKTQSGEPALHMVRRSFLSATHPAFTYPVRRDRRKPIPSI